MSELEIKFKRLTSDAIIPTKANASDLGFDLYCLERVTIWSGQTTKIKTGIACGFPTGVAGLILDRSSIGSKGAKVMGGVIDQAYTGELIVCICNMNANDWVTFERGAKIAQLILIPSLEATIIEVDQLGETDRGTKGFGSSGS